MINGRSCRSTASLPSLSVCRCMTHSKWLPAGTPLGLRLAVHSEYRNGCLVWTGATMPNGYGRIGVKGKSLLVHRVAYTLITGQEIPEGLTIDHLCKVRNCIDVRHMEVVTRGENTLRGSSPAALAKNATHCVNGHEYTDASTYHYRGKRFCRTCRKAAARNFRKGKTWNNQTQRYQ